MKAYSIILPYYVNKPVREYIAKIGNYLSKKDYRPRHNGINGANCELIQIPGNICYLPFEEYLGLKREIPAPTPEVIEWATAIAIEHFDKFEGLDDISKQRILRNVYTLLGYNSPKPSEFVLFTEPKTHHPANKIDYKGTIRLAERLGIKTVNVLEFRIDPEEEVQS